MGKLVEMRKALEEIRNLAQKKAASGNWNPCVDNFALQVSLVAEEALRGNSLPIEQSVLNYIDVNG